MAVPRLPFSAVRMAAQPVPWDRFDDQFWKLVADAKVDHGYFALRGPDEAALLFVVNGAPYGSGRVEGDRVRFGEVKEFFEFYHRQRDLPLACYQADKGLILGLLALFQKTATQQFTTEMMDPEETISKLTAKGVNAVITYRTAERVGVSLFMKGRVQFNYFSEDDPAALPKETEPLDALLVYLYGKKEEGAVTVAIYEEPKVAAAQDAPQAKGTPRARLTQVYAPPPPPAPAAPAALAGPKPELIIMFGGKTLERHPMVVEQITIGRAPGNDIRIDNLGVSRNHAVIRMQDGRYLVEDKASANGTFVNGERIAAPHELRDGDQITIVKHTILFQMPKPAAAAAPVEFDAEQTMFVSPGAPPRPAPPAGPAPAVSGTPPRSAPAPAGPPRPTGTPRLILPDLSEYPITKPTVYLGTGYESDIKAEGFMLAKQHARIDKDKEGRCRFVKMGRLGSTKVNQQKVDTKILRDNDVIEIGNSKFIFRVE